MIIEDLPKYFLSANSADGFINGFSNSFDVKENWKAYLIKGGPGTGKSSFMKRIAEIGAEKGEMVDIVPCSSDPDSLDAVILKKRKIAVFDATAPHVLDPIYPGACEEILNFGEFWNVSSLDESKDEIISFTDLNKTLHRRASRYISAVGQIKRNEQRVGLRATDIDKAFDFASSLCTRYIKPVGNSGKEKTVYLSAITPQGEVFYGDTINLLCSRKIIIKDDYGTVSNIIFSVIRDYALKCGEEIITVKNNILPNELIDHILIPNLSLAFCSKIADEEGENIKRINALRFMDKSVLGLSKEKVRFGRRLARELTNAAVSTLSEAKTVHDKLESIYIKAMDFEKLSEFAKKFNNVLFMN